MKWRETGHDALRCIRRIVLLHAALAVHAIDQMHHWYLACILSLYECPEDLPAKGVGADLSERQFVSPESRVRQACKASQSRQRRRRAHGSLTLPLSLPPRQMECLPCFACRRASACGWPMPCTSQHRRKYTRTRLQQRKGQRRGLPHRRGRE